MKKYILLLLLPLLFINCSSDNDDDLVYLDKALLEGAWYNIKATDSTVMIFRNGTAKRESWHKYNEKLEDERFLGEYRFTKDRIYFSNGGKNGSALIMKDDCIGIFNIEDYIMYKKVK